MQRMDSLNPTKGKTFFKKRAHRPWNTALLETAVEEASSLEMPTELFSSSDTEIQNALTEKTHQRNEISAQLSEEKRILIGGFLHPENIFLQNDKEKKNESNQLLNDLKIKEQEILSLSNDLKVAKAIEQVERLENARKKEEEARMAAEAKALFAIREAKLAAEQAYKIEQQLTVEKQNKLKEEKARKHLEEKNLITMREIQQKEQLLEKEIKEKEHILTQAKQAQLIAEDKIKQAQTEMVLLEQKITAEAQDKIKKIVDEMCHQIEKYKKICDETNQKASEKILQLEKAAEKKIADIETKSEEKMKSFQKQSEEKIARIQNEATRRVQDIQKQIQIQEKAKLSLQAWAKKAADSANQIELAKKEIEEKLTATIQTASEERIKFENKVQQLLAEILSLQNQKKGAEEQKEQLDLRVRYFEKTNNDISNELETIRTTLGNERIASEIKTNTLLNEIADLKKQEETIKEAQTQLEKDFSAAQITIQSMRNIVETERNLRKALEEKLEGNPIRIDEQKRKFAENKILELAKQMGDMEIEKAKLIEQIAKTNETLNTLQIMLDSEKTIRTSLESQLKESMGKIFNLESLKQKEQDARAAAEQQASMLSAQNEHFEQEFSQFSKKVTEANNRAKELDLRLEFEKSARLSAEQNLTILQNQKNHLEEEKAHNEQKIEMLLARTRELEVMLSSEIYLRKEAERLKDIEEQAKKAAQEKISQAIEQANRMVLNALGNLATPNSTGET